MVLTLCLTLVTVVRSGLSAFAAWLMWYTASKPAVDMFRGMIRTWKQITVCWWNTTIIFMAGSLSLSWALYVSCGTKNGTRWLHLPVRYITFHSANKDRSGSGMLLSRSWLCHAADLASSHFIIANWAGSPPCCALKRVSRLVQYAHASSNVSIHRRPMAFMSLTV